MQVRRIGGESGVDWWHVDLKDEQDVHWLCHDSGLDGWLVEALMASETRPRVSVHDEHMLAILRGVNLNPGADPDDMVSLRIWAGTDRIVSAWRRHLLSVEDVAGAIDAGRGPRSPGEFLEELARQLVTRMGDTIETLDEAVARLESSLLERGVRVAREDLSSVRRQIITLRRYLSPQRDALSRMAAERLAWIDPESRLGLRETQDRLTRYVEDLDALRERASLIHEELVSQLSEQLNSRMYVLSLVAAFFLPLGFLTGLLGVNLGGIPGSDVPYAFGLFTALLVIVVVAQAAYMFRRGWLSDELGFRKENEDGADDRR